MDELQTIVIHRNVADVFAYLTDFKNEVQWRSELLSMQRRPEFPKEVGAHYVQEVHWEGRRLEIDLDVTRVEVCRRIEFEGHDEGVTAKASFTLEPAPDESTKLTAAAHFETSGPLYVLEPFMRALVARQVTQDLQRLQALLEAHQEAGAARGAPSA